MVCRFAVCGFAVRPFAVLIVLVGLAGWQAPSIAARTQAFDFPISVDSSFIDPEAVAVGDIDGDGRPDLVAAGAEGVVWWKETMGSFTPTVVNATAALEIDVRDLDADGDLDVAIVTASSLLLAKNSGNGSSFVVSTVHTGLSFKTAEIADIDGDGKLDILAAFTTGVDWWRNTAGDGSAFTRTTIGALTSGSGAAAGDFDNDGDLDVVSTSDGSSDRVRHFSNALGNGTSWTGNDVALVLDGVRSPVVADFNGDGWLDVAVGLLGEGTTLVFTNDGTPGTGTWSRTGAGLVPAVYRIEVADLDLDGDPDLLTVGDEEISWHETVSRAPLVFETHFLVSPIQARVAAIADFDRDEDLDIVFGEAAKDTVVFFPNQSMRRSYLARPQLDIDTPDGARAVAAGDLDNDGDVDLAVAAFAGNQVRWEENTPAGWVSRSLSPALNGAFGVAIADLDGDGDNDILAAGATANAVVFWRNGWPAFNSFTQVNVGTLSGARGVAAGDVDRDGDLDVVGAGWGDDIFLFTNNGPATSFVQSNISTTFQRAQSVDLADVDGDGDLDILAAGSTADEVAWWQNTAGSFTKRTISGATLDGAYSVIAADVDQDGDIDAVSTAEFGDKLTFWANTNGDGITWAGTNLSFLNQPQFAEVADFDGDGDLDILGAAWKLGSESEISFFRNNNGVGTSWTENQIVGGTSFNQPSGLAVADFNRDGLPDFAATAETSDKVAVWLNGGGQYGLATTVLSGPSLPANTETTLFRLTLTPRGSIMENEVELATIELLLEEAPAVPLTSAQAATLFTQIEILRDHPTGGTPGVLDPADVSLVPFTDFTLTPAGRLTVRIPDDTAFASVGQGTSGVFFVTATTVSSYASLFIRDLRITHLTESTSRGEDLFYDTELRQEWAANGATAFFPINDFADLRVEVVDSADPVTAGAQLTYTVTVTNLGPDTATGVVLSSILPAGTTLVSTTGCTESPAGGVPTCTIGSLASAASTQVTLLVTVSPGASGTLVYQAAVDGSLFDPVAGNDSRNENTAVTASANLGIDLISGLATYGDGAPMAWRAVVSNLGPGAANGATISVDLPAVLTAVAWTCTGSGGATCGTPSGSGDIVGTTGNLPAGGVLTYHLRSQVPDNLTSTLNASASVAVGPNTVDAVPGNNSDTVALNWGNPIFYDGFESGNTSAWQ